MPYETSEAILFQRFSVILSDFFLIFAAWRFVHSVSFPSSANAPAPGSTILSISPGERKKNLAVFSMIILNVGLLLVDHIHFQYNGLLMGLLILSFDAANRGNHIMLTVYFSVLVLMKHLFVFFVPVFGLYLLRSYCGWDGFNFRVDSHPKSFDLTSDSDNSCDVSDRTTYSEESPLSDKISSLKPSTVLTLPQSTVSGKGKKKKKKQVQNVLKISPINTGEIKVKVINNSIEGKKCNKADVKNKTDKKKTKTGHFFRRFFILVCIAVIALTAAFGPFLIDFSSLEGAQIESIIRAKECRRNSITNIFDEIEDDNMNCDNIEERGREIGDRKRFSISLEYDQITQIFQRLFPFGRGLVHAYWAPNVWALYCGVDKTADLILRKRKQIGRIFLRKFRAVHKISKNTFWLSNIYLRKFSDYGSYLIKKWDKNNSFMLMTFQLSIEMDILKNHFKSHYHKIKDSIITNFKIVANSKEFKAMKENGISYLKNRDNLTSAEGDDLVSSSSGLIGNFRLFILPNISASLALLFTIISMFPAFFVLVYNRKYDGMPLSLSVGHTQSDEVYLNSCSNEIVKDEVAVAVAVVGVGVTGVRTGSLAGAGVGSGTGVGVECVKSVRELGHLVNHTNIHTNTSSNTNANTNTCTMQRSNIKHNAHITPNLLIRSVLYTSLCSFMLGYHVHEKAIIIPMLCAAIMSSRSNRDAVLFIKLSAIGVFSLFPLFTGIDELMIKCKFSSIILCNLLFSFFFCVD